MFTVAGTRILIPVLALTHFLASFLLLPPTPSCQQVSCGEGALPSATCGAYSCNPAGNAPTTRVATPVDTSTCSGSLVSGAAAWWGVGVRLGGGWAGGRESRLSRVRNERLRPGLAPSSSGSIRWLCIGRVLQLSWFLVRQLMCLLLPSSTPCSTCPGAGEPSCG